MSGFQQFGFGQDDSNVGNKGKRFKMDKNQVARISFLWWEGLEDGKLNLEAATPKFTGGPRHYMKGVGYFMNQGPEYTKIAGESPKMRINTLIVKWPTKQNGSLDVEAITRGEAEVLYWVFDGGKYDMIKPIHAEWHLGAHDLKVSCSDAAFQKMSFSPTKESMLAKLASKPDNSVFKSIITQAQGMIPGVTDEVGKTMTIEQIREKLAGGTGQAAGSANGVPSEAAPVISEDMDKALDDFLEN